MNYFESFAISAAGMDIERTRLDVATMNLANANTIASPGTTGYRPMKVVARTAAIVGGSFDDAVGIATQNLPMASIEPILNEAKLIYEPENPMADKKGYVSYPNVDNANEMMTVMSAMRAYEANVAAMNAAKSMAIKSLDIGGQ